MVDTTHDKRLGCRFNLWFVLTAFSVVVLSAVTSDTTNLNDRTRTQQWAMSVSAISLSLGALACLANAFARTRFVGTPIEGGLVTLCLGLWAAVLPSMMNPKTHIALLDYFQMTEGPRFDYALNANVYFFAWGSFIISMILGGSFLQELMEAQWPERSFKRTMWWLGHAAACCVVMASGSRTFHLANCQRSVTPFFDDSCERVKLAVSVGAAGGALAILMALVSHLKQLLVESFVAIVLIIMWCFAVSYITFGSKAPATNVGDLYFSTWFAFTFALFVGADVVGEVFCKLFCKDEQAATTTSKDASTEKQEVAVDKPTEEDPAIMEASNV